MKKIFTTLILASLLLCGIFAEKYNWDGAIGISFGASVCKTNFTLSGADKNYESELKGVSFDFANLDMRYVNKSNNIALLVGFGSGLFFSPSIAVGDNNITDLLDGAIGNYTSFFAGLGYNFKLSNRFSITPSFVVGFEYVSIDERRKDDRTRGVEAKFMEEQVGADIHADFRINDKWSVFLAAAGKFKFMGTYRYSDYTEKSYDFESTYQKDDTKIGFAISPRIGISYHNGH